MNVAENAGFADADSRDARPKGPGSKDPESIDPKPGDVQPMLAVTEGTAGYRLSSEVRWYRGRPVRLFVLTCPHVVRAIQG